MSVLTDDELAEVVRLAPLISIDMIVRDQQSNILVALRTNEPAKGTFFVPGGRIRKNETIESAFGRILKMETGCCFPFDKTKFLGVYQHMYATNCFGLDGYGTHYIVLAYEVQFESQPTIVLDGQHRLHRWMNEDELTRAADVHENTKAYFL